MSSAVSYGSGRDQEIRKGLIDTGHVDVVIAIGTNFFYTRSLPCTLWFFDKGKGKDLQDQVLMIDARNIYRVVNRRINDFSPEQLKNITSIVHLYRGEQEKYQELMNHYEEDGNEKQLEWHKERFGNGE